MNDILRLVIVYEVLIYCQTIQGVGGYWKDESDNVEYATVYSPVILLQRVGEYLISSWKNSAFVHTCCSYS